MYMDKTKDTIGKMYELFLKTASHTKVGDQK